MKKWKILSRKRLIKDCTLTESISLEDDGIRRYTATIEGWQNFKLYEGKPYPGLSKELVIRIKEIKEAVDNGDNQIFYAKVKEVKI